MRVLLVAIVLRVALASELVLDSPVAAVAQPADTTLEADPALLVQDPAADMAPEGEGLGAAPLEVVEPPLVIGEPLLASELPTEEPVVIPVPSSPVPTSSPSAWQHTAYPWATGAPGDGLDVKFIQDMDHARDAGQVGGRVDRG